MIRVLLADDEPFIRQGLRIIVDWEKYGYEIVAEAKNGMEALGILTEEPIDLAFVDLKMPGMSGLELIEKTLALGNESTHFIILTGYADFNAARQALKLRVEDYLLKPIQREELEQVLKRLKDELRREPEETDPADGRQIVEQMAEYTREHFQENLSLVEMGGRYHINNVYLGQIFKSRFGMTYKEYLNRLRVEKAAELLDNTSMRIYDIAERVGYRNADYFISRFTGIKGITPKQYRIRRKGVDEE